MNNFGASGPQKLLQDEFGFRKENAVAAAKEQLRRAR
jgi:transketolase